MIAINIRGAGVYRSETFHKDKTDITPPRKVRSYEFEFFKKDYEYGFVNNQKIHYKKNSILIVKPGDVRQSKKHFSCYFVHVDIQDNAICNMLNSLPSVIAVDNESKYTQIFGNICSAFPYTDNTQNIAAIGWLMILISSLSKTYSNAQQIMRVSSENQRSAIISAKTYMNLNYNLTIDLKDIADSAHLSPNYFHKLFSAACGISPLQYLTNIRIDKAKSELWCSEKTITQIADHCGFNSYSYFCTVFKKHCGVSPNEFRKRMNKYYSE